jgi:hypothetical protein
MSVRRVNVSSSSTSSATISAFPRIEEGYVSLDRKEAKTDPGESKESYVLPKAMMAKTLSLKPIITTFKYEVTIDVTGSASVFSVALFSGRDNLIDVWAQLYDEIRFIDTTVALDGRDLLHNMDSQTPSTSGFLISGIWGGSQMVSVDPASQTYLWDRVNSRVLNWSSAKPVVQRTFKSPYLTLISSGVQEPTLEGWYNLPRVAAFTATDYQQVRLWLGFSGLATSLTATTHNYVIGYITHRCELRKRRGSA